jgi:hypothetical protein
VKPGEMGKEKANHEVVESIITNTLALNFLSVLENSKGYSTASRLEGLGDFFHHISCGAIHIESLQDSMCIVVGSSLIYPE